MQLEFKKTKGWGGKRKGAGRPNRSGLVSHGRRQKITGKTPLHLTMRLKKGAPSLRTKQTLAKFLEAAEKAKKTGLRVVHFDLLSNHIHLIVEANDNQSLSRGMKSLNGRLGKILKGVFAGRFHMHILKTPREVKNALAYVLLNKSKHENATEYIDPFSSGYSFYNWKLLLKDKFQGLIAEQLEMVRKMAMPKKGLSAPRSWLLSVGWTRCHS